MAFQKGDVGGWQGWGGVCEWQCGRSGQLESRKSAPDLWIRGVVDWDRPQIPL